MTPSFSKDSIEFTVKRKSQTTMKRIFTCSRKLQCSFIIFLIVISRSERKILYQSKRITNLRTLKIFSPHYCVLNDKKQKK